LVFFRNEEIVTEYMNMNPKKVVMEALKIRNRINSELDSEENVPDLEFDQVEPFKVYDDIRLIVGQDPTFKNQLSRKYLKKTLISTNLEAA
jgi:hypothetical protein